MLHPNYLYFINLKKNVFNQVSIIFETNILPVKAQKTYRKIDRSFGLIQQLYLIDKATKWL